MFMTINTASPRLDSESINTIENVAMHIAAKNDGRLSPVQLMPYFSLSSQDLDRYLSEMVDDISITQSIRQGIKTYEFSNLAANLLPGISLNARPMNIVDKDIYRTRLEHQIVHAAHKAEGRVSAESIAVNSEFTLKEIKEVLQELSVEKFIAQGMDEDNGNIYYTLPQVEYPARNFKDNMQHLRIEDPVASFDAQLAVFFKYIVICLIMLCVLFLAKVNFRFLTVFFLASIPFSFLMTYLNYKKNKSGLK